MNLCMDRDFREEKEADITGEREAKLIGTFEWIPLIYPLLSLLPPWQKEQKGGGGETVSDVV